MQVIPHDPLQGFHAFKKRLPHLFIFGRFWAKRLRGEGLPNDAKLLINWQSCLIYVIRRRNSQFSQHGFGIAILRIVVESIVHLMPPDIL